MKKLIGLLFILSIFLYSCSEKQDTLSVGTHPDGWNNTQSDLFHGKAVVESGTENCQSCHGEDYQGGSSEVSCYQCHNYFPHPEEWNNTQSEQFHAKVVVESGPESCQDCHGTDYLGGTSGVSCYHCHGGYPHPAGFADINAPGFHGEVIKLSPVSWDIRSCKSCHGEDYSGGDYAPSCTTCHSAEDGPEACNTCHGSPANIAPPQDLSNNTTNTAIGVGAHQIHVASTVVTLLYSCEMCHREVDDFDDHNHIDGTPHAEVIFDELATNSGALNTNWDRNTASCSQVYCHGSFTLGSGGQITGKSDPVVWTEVNPDPAACNFCHDLPPAGHPGQGQFTTPESCAQCHGSVVNSSGIIINKSLHINGEANFN